MLINIWSFLRCFKRVEVVCIYMPGCRGHGTLGGLGQRGEACPRPPPRENGARQSTGKGLRAGGSIYLERQERTDGMVKV